MEAGVSQPVEQRRRRRRRWLDRTLLRPIGVAIAIGAVCGVLLHILDSAPEGVAFGGMLLRIALAFTIVLGGIVGLGRMVMLGEPALVLGCTFVLVSTVATYPFGPTWIPGETVPGTYTLAIENTGMAPAKGDLICTWLPGRWQMGDFSASVPIAIPGDEMVVLRASFTIPQVRLERTATDGRLRAPYISSSSVVLEPPRLDTGQPARTADGRSGQVSLLLFIDTSSPPAGGVVGWTAPMSGDRSGDTRASVTWDCAGP